MKRQILALCALFAALSVVADARDGLKFWWKAEKKTATGAALEAREFPERVTYSAASSPVVPGTLYQNTGEYTHSDGAVFAAVPMVVTNMAVYCPTSKRTVQEDCLYLSQPTNYSASGVLMQDYQSVTLPGASAMIGKKGTLFVRFKWLGRCENTSDAVNFIGMGAYWKSCGWVLALNGYGSQYGSYVQFRNFTTGNGYMSQATASICQTNQWTELAVTVDPVVVDGVEKTQVKLYKRREGRDTFDMVEFLGDAITAPGSGANYKCRISNTDQTGWKAGGSGSTSFRGFVHELKMYDRVLDENEILQMMAGDDLEWTIGTKNDSAAEFCDDGAAAVYEPATMPWHRFRRRLTATNPSVSILTELDADGFDLARLLQIRVLGDAPNYSRLAVSVNGTPVADKDLHLATAQNDGNVFVFLPETTMQTLALDAGTGKYPMTLTLTRTGEMSGAIELDWLYLGGSFQLGKLDGVKTEFGPNDPKYYHYLTPMRDIKQLSSSFGQNAGSQYISLDVSFFMPEGATNYPHRLCMTGFNHAAYSLYLNEKTEACLIKTVTDCAVPYEVELPAGSLNAGLNRLYFVGSGDGRWSDFECMRLKIDNNGGKNRDPRAGTVLIVL